MTPQVSFIIPSYHAGSTLPRCLHSIYAQQTEIPFEVIVVDSSEDKAEEQLLLSFPRVQWICTGQRMMPGAARNRGLAEARASLAAFVDADVVLDPAWLKSGMELLDETHSAILGTLAPYQERNWSGLCLFLVQFSKFFPGTPIYEPAMAACYALLTRTRDARQAGGFPEDTPMLEDFAFSLRLVRTSGKPILFHPGLGACHINKRGWKVIATQMRGHGIWAARTRRQADFPGHFLVRYPPLILALPPYRLVLTAWRTFRWGPDAFFHFLLLMPLVAWSLWIWAWSFFRCAWRHD